MKRKIFLMTVTLLILILLASSIHITPVSAQSGGTYDLTWNSFDGGGGTSTGGVYALNGTIGQADAGTMTGGNYRLAGGFWVEILTNKVYLPLIVR